MSEALQTHLVGASAMASRAVALISERLEAGARPGDVVVLARVNATLLPVQVALGEAGTATTAPLDASVLGRTGIRTALAYLRIALDPERIRREDVLDTINRPARKVKSAVSPLLRSGRWSLAKLEQVQDALSDPHRERFGDYLGDLHDLIAEVREEADTARCLWVIRNRIGLGEAMDALDASRTRPEGSSHGDDLDALEQLAALHPDPATFGAWLTDRLRAPADPDGVALSTVHRVKGREWPHVIVFAASDGLMPHRLSDDLEEERRVFHVAVTRCQQRVDVIGDERRPSPFVAELRRAPGSDRTRRPEATRGLVDPVEPTLRDDGAVVAEAGLAVTTVGGFAGRVVEVEPGRARLRLSEPDGLEVEVPFGQPVTVGGRETTLAAAPRAGRAAGLVGLDDDEQDQDLVDALKAWRRRVADEEHVPPYLVFHDRHLEAIAGRKPRTLRELADCPGVGPTKLERFGDDLLAVLEDHLEQ